MKKCLFIYIIIQFLFISCFEDESNTNIKSLNPIVIENVDFRGYLSYSLYMGDTLKIHPLVYCDGIPDTKMSFEWKIFGTGTVPKIIDSTMYLCAKITQQPAARPYTLRFTIKDETTGIKRVETCHITVLSPFSEGIIVADTKDGVNSDLSLVMSREFSSLIPKENKKMNIFRNVWEMANGSPIPGLVLDATTSSYGQNRSLTLLTTKHLLRADHNDYVNIPSETDENLFPVVPDHIGHGYTHGVFSIYTGTKHEIMAANGKLTTRSVQNNGRKFTYTFYPTGISDYNVTMMYAANYYPSYAYDALNKMMLFVDYGKCWAPQEQASGSKFDVSDLSDYTPLFLGEISQGITLLTKQISTGAYKGLVMNKHSRNSPNYAKAVFDFSNATDIDNAKFFELNTREDVVYYATEDKLYTTPTSNIDSKLQWTAKPGDKITGIKIYDWQGGNRRQEDNSGEPAWGNSQNRIIMIMTYNEVMKEGKITCVPIVTFGIGGLEQNEEYHVKLHNFNKILGVYKQVK